MTTTTITGLDEDTSYSVQVRAKNAEGTSAWSTVATLKTNKDANNRLYSLTRHQRIAHGPWTRTRLPGRDVGSAVSATDDRFDHVDLQPGRP